MAQEARKFESQEEGNTARAFTKDEIQTMKEAMEADYGQSPKEPEVVTSKERQELIDRVGLATVKHALSGTPMHSDGTINTEAAFKLQEPLNDNEPAKSTEAPRDPSIIPPQVREPWETVSKNSTTPEDSALEEIRGVGSGWTDAKKYVIEQAKDKVPYSVFGRFAAKMNRLGTRILTAPKRELLWTMHNMRSELAAKANGKVEGYKAEVKKCEEELAEKDRKIKESSQKIQSGTIAGLFTPDVAAKLDRERRAIVDKMEKAKAKQNKAVVKLDAQKHKEEYWSNRKSALAETIVNGIEKDLAPARAEFISLTARKEEVGKKLEDLKRAREMGHAGLIDIEAKLKSNPGLIDNVALHETRDAVHAMLERMDGIYKDLSGKQSAIEAKMGDVNTYLGEGVKAQTKELNQTTKDRLRYDQGEQARGELGRVEHDFDHAPEPKAPEAAIGKEPALELEPAEYVALWNVLYGKELKIKVDVFATGMKSKANEVQNVKSFEEYIKNKMLPKDKPYSEAQLETRFAKIRDLIKQGL